MAFKDGAYYCYCAYVLRIARYSGFLQSRSPSPRYPCPAERENERLSISYPESSGFLVSGATPGRLWGHQKNSIFLIGCSVTVSIVLPQKSCGNKIRCPQSLPGVAPLTKKPEDSGYEIERLWDKAFRIAFSLAEYLSMRNRFRL